VQSTSAPAGATDTVTLSAAARAALALQSGKNASSHAPASAAPAPNLTYKAPPAHIHADIHMAAQRASKARAAAVTAPSQGNGKRPRHVATNGNRVSLAKRFMYNAWLNASSSGAVNSARAARVSQPWKLPRANVASSINAQITSFNLLPPHDQQMIAAAHHETRLEFLTHLQSLLAQLDIQQQITVTHSSVPQSPALKIPDKGATPAQGSGGPPGG
jgi:hypothetical protein